MNNNRHRDVVFETIAGCTLLASAAAFASVVYRLITLTVPLLELMARAEVLK